MGVFLKDFESHSFCLVKLSLILCLGLLLSISNLTDLRKVSRVLFGRLGLHPDFNLNFCWISLFLDNSGSESSLVSLGLLFMKSMIL